MLSVIYAECHIQALYAECHYGERQNAECRYAECRSTASHFILFLILLFTVWQTFSLTY